MKRLLTGVATAVVFAGATWLAVHFFGVLVDAGDAIEEAYGTRAAVAAALAVSAGFVGLVAGATGLWERPPRTVRRRKRTTPPGLPAPPQPKNTRDGKVPS